MTPDKPFFVYFATGGVHAPHMVHKKWADKYAGKFDQGWDKLREETLARQLEAGVVPEGTVLALKPEEVDDWDSHTDDERRLYARQAEFFAGLVEHTDYQAGRVVEALPHGGGVRGVHERRRDREGPVVVEPPEGQPRLARVRVWG